ncbi:MAG: tetratricopeptide repeat protein [Sphingomonadales bacterium]|jgi:tetratricopeptide (TPR) repeat protein
MKQTAGLLLALAGAAPALGHGLARDDIRPRTDGLNPASVTDACDIAAALDEGRSLLAAGNAAQAISAFRAALDQDDRSVAALNGIAIAYDRLGRVDLARQHFEMALTIEPDAADIAYNLGWTLHRAGQQRDAIPWLQRASAGNDGRAAAAARRALLLVAAAIEAEAAAPVPSSDVPQGSAAPPLRVASARIDIASSGEAVLVLPAAIAHPAASDPVVAAEPPRLAGGVVIAGDLAAMAGSALPVLAPPLTPAGDAAPTLAADRAQAAPAWRPAADAVAAQLGDLAALTIPLVTVTPPGSDGEAAPLLPQVIRFGDAPPLPPPEDAPPLRRVAAATGLRAAPLRLLDLAVLPELATAAPLALQPPLAATWQRPLLAVDFLAGFDATRLIGDGGGDRLRTALAAQADVTRGDDRDALRLAIARLEALIDRIGALRG